jgi:hypothetical protein
VRERVIRRERKNEIDVERERGVGKKEAAGEERHNEKKRYMKCEGNRWRKE